MGKRTAEAVLPQGPPPLPQQQRQQSQSQQLPQAAHETQDHEQVQELLGCILSPQEITKLLNEIQKEEENRDRLGEDRTKDPVEHQAQASPPSL